nr:hypothetical protein [Tanacetum cinerariifolium]
MTREEDDGISVALGPQEVVFLGGTTLAEVTLVKGHELLTIVKVLLSPDTRVQSGQPVMTREEDDGISVEMNPQVKDNKENDKIRAKTRQNQEQTGSVEKSKIKPDKVKAQSKTKNTSKCSSCEALYTTDYCCSDGSLRDKIICDLDKTPNLSQRSPQNCPKCGHPIDGHYCQGCALLRKKFKEDLFTYCIENRILQDSSEPSNDNTNVVNALQEPFVGNQDPGKNSSQSPPQINHHCCYECGDLLEDIFCHQCTCELCGNGVHYGYYCPSKVPVVPNLEPFNNQIIDDLPQTVPSFDLTCYSKDGNSFTYDSTYILVHDSPNVFNPPLQPPIYPYEFYGNDAYYGHDCSLQVPFTYDPEPCYNQDFNFPKKFQIFQQYPCCTRCGGPHETCQCDQLIFDELYCENYEGPRMNFQCQPMNQNHYEPNPCYDSNSFAFDQFQPPLFPIREKTCAELLAKEQEANINTHLFQYFIVPQPPQEEMSVEFLQEKRNQMDSVITFLRMFNQISFYEMPKDILELFKRLHNDEKNIHEELVVYINTPNWNRPTICYDDDDEDYAIAFTPSLPIKEPDNSLSMRDEHLETISINLRIFFDSNDGSTSNDDDSFSIDNIKYVEASPPNSELVSSEVMEIVIPEVGGIDDDILLTIKYDILCKKLLNVNLLIANIEVLNDNPTPFFDLMTKSSSTSLNSLLEETNTFDNSLPNLKFSALIWKRLVAAVPLLILIFLFQNMKLSMTIMSGFYKFTDELGHIISPPEYDCFCFKIEPNSGDFTMDVVEDIFPTREPRVHNALPTHPTLQLNLDFILSNESLFTYVVWIFLPFVSYSVTPKHLLSFENEDTIFDPGICSYHISSFMPDVSHRSGTLIKFKVLNESPMEIYFPLAPP